MPEERDGIPLEDQLKLIRKISLDVLCGRLSGKHSSRYLYMVLAFWLSRFGITEEKQIDSYFPSLYEPTTSRDSDRSGTSSSDEHSGANGTTPSTIAA